MLQHFGHNLRVAREARQWTQDQLSSRTNPRIGQRKISNFERGLQPRPWEITALAKALGVAPAVLAGEPLITIPDDSTSDTQPAV